MKPLLWTQEKVINTAKKYDSPFALKRNEPVAYKKLREYGLVEVLYPIELRKRRQPYSKEELLSLMSKCTSRSDFQLKFPSAYNSSKKQDLIKVGFPISNKYKLFGRLPYTKQELVESAQRYSSIKEWNNKESGAAQAALRQGIAEEYGPAPTQGISIAEKELVQWLNTCICSDFKTKRFSNNYELDAYSESLNIGIEYNGLYWHSEDNKNKLYHINKTKYFEKLGIRLIHIWEYEWRDRNEQVKDFIRSACKKNTVRVGARKCLFREISSKEAKEFLNKTHIQGANNQSTFCIGCFYNGELIGACTFGKHHRNSIQWVLNRFACLPNHTISGFLAKASKMATKYLNSDIYSWAHITKSQASGYLASGWTIVSISKPDYFYSNSKGEYISKQSRKKSNVNTPLNMTEKQHAKKDRLYRIWDCGKITLLFKK